MTAKDHDVIVVGGGVMGSATARALARRGVRVALLERWHVGHVRGSSHGRARIFRLSYPDARYVAMAQGSVELWRDLEAETWADILLTTGGLDGGKRLDEHIAALDACSARYEMIDAAEVARRWPVMRLPADQDVLFQPDAGIVAADRAWSAFARSAARHGAEVMEGARVLGFEEGPGARVEVTASSDGNEARRWTAEVVVVTAGSWARGLLEPLGIALETKSTRETVAFFDVDEERLPTFVDWGDPSVYALPSPGQGLKVGEHIAGPVVDPNGTGSVGEESVARLARWVAERFPGAPASPHHAETCLYTVTPDEHFVLERHGSFVVGSPCSGHGFKFAPWIGERLAQLATE
ncbi:MAG: FAD-dependent oxidoreductase [Actinomycetota bacterium]